MAFFENVHCTGCSACYSICPENCIKMVADEEGFLYPKIVEKEKCLDCKLCSECCPLIKEIDRKKDGYPKTYAAMNKNEDIRKKSSSGGIFYLLAEEIIFQNGIVFGAKFSSEFSVIHGSENTIKGIAEFYGSKYVQSTVGETFRECKENLDGGKIVLYSGTPCQIEGLKAFLQCEYENLYCVDIICMSVPSPKLWEKYINWQNLCYESTTQKISFRYKNPNWKQKSMRIEFNNGLVYLDRLSKDPYGRIFGSEIGSRYSCYDCRFRTINRSSDITIADFWGIGNILPEMDDDKGTSLIMVNTSKGENLFEKMNSKCKTMSVKIEDGIKFNQRAIKNKKYNLKELKKKREKLFKYLDVLPFDILVKKCVDDPIVIKGIKFIRRCFTKIKRIIKNMGTSLNKR